MVGAGMEEAVQVPYSGGNINKLDVVGIPDFAAGAMENWGLITFREADLLVPPGDPNTSGASIRQLYHVPTVIAHEVSHMWFGALPGPAVLCMLRLRTLPPGASAVRAGDLVTLPWWTELWLNEGFAEYFERIAAAFLWNAYNTSALPQEFTAPGALNYMGGFVADVLDKALQFDALPSTFALARPEAAVQSRANAASAFGQVAYKKGASVLRMMHAHMLRRAAAAAPAESGTYTRLEWPEERAWQVRRLLRAGGPPPPADTPGSADDMFFHALRAYLQAYQFGTGRTNTLLESMEAATGLPVTVWGDAWTKRKGSPMLTVSRAGANLRIEQTPPDVADGGEGQQLWWIPVTYRGIGGSGADVHDADAAVLWVEMNDATVEVPWPSAGAAVKVNVEHLGSYRYGPHTHPRGPPRCHHACRPRRCCRRARVTTGGGTPRQLPVAQLPP